MVVESERSSHYSLSVRLQVSKVLFFICHQNSRCVAPWPVHAPNSHVNPNVLWATRPLLVHLSGVGKKTSAVLWLRN